ncbi:MAG: sugar nucleotide-binding protein [FCB group bacterium]|jgi:dTDP-4-dehydrorhamnose reductase
MEKQKILITGATSKLAEAIVPVLVNETDHDLILISAHNDKLQEFKYLENYKLSILEIKEVKKLCYKLKPDIIVNTSSVSDIKICENNKKLAWDLNVTAVENLASIARVIDAHLICFSSDWVFDGFKGPYTEEDKPNPSSYYGKTKHAMENESLYNLKQCTILRTSELYGMSSFGKKDFIDRVHEAFDNEDEIYFSEGRFCNPVFIEDVALAVMNIIEMKKTGVYHCGGSNWLSEYEIFRKTAGLFEYDIEKISMLPIEKNLKNMRPCNKFGLITLKAQTELGVKFVSLESGISTIKYRQKELEKWQKD